MKSIKIKKSYMVSKSLNANSITNIREIAKHTNLNNRQKGYIQRLLKNEKINRKQKISRFKNWTNKHQNLFNKDKKGFFRFNKRKRIPTNKNFFKKPKMKINDILKNKDYQQMRASWGIDDFNFSEILSGESLFDLATKFLDSIGIDPTQLDLDDIIKLMG